MGDDAGGGAAQHDVRTEGRDPHDGGARVRGHRALGDRGGHRRGEGGVDEVCGAVEHDLTEVERADHRSERDPQPPSRGLEHRGPRVVVVGLRERGLEPWRRHPRLEAGLATARAGGAAVGADRDVTDLARGAAGPAQLGPAEHQTSADAVADRHDHRVAGSVALSVLGQGGRVGVVDDDDGEREVVRQQLLQRQVVPVEVGSRADGAVLDEAGGADADPEHRPVGQGGEPGEQVDDDAESVGALASLEPLRDPLDDGPVEPVDRGTQQGVVGQVEREHVTGVGVQLDEHGGLARTPGLAVTGLAQQPALEQLGHVVGHRDAGEPDLASDVGAGDPPVVQHGLQDECPVVGAGVLGQRLGHRTERSQRTHRGCSVGRHGLSRPC